jgi:hypothetical protein
MTQAFQSGVVAMRARMVTPFRKGTSKTQQMGNQCFAIYEFRIPEPPSFVLLAMQSPIGELWSKVGDCTRKRCRYRRIRAPNCAETLRDCDASGAKLAIMNAEMIR